MTSDEAGTSVDAATSRAPFDAARPYEKHPQVAIRPESFGALAYHYGNRRLVFLKAPALVTVVERSVTSPAPPPRSRRTSRMRSAKRTPARCPACSPRT